jgi:hypothetical protein
MPDLFDRLRQEVADRERQEGLSASDLLELPAELRRVVLLIARHHELSLSALASELGMPAADLQPLMADLSAKGLIRAADVAGEPLYRTFFGRRRTKELPASIWEALADRARGDRDE